MERSRVRLPPVYNRIAYRSTQPSIPPGKVNRVPAYELGLRRGAFTCVDRVAGNTVTLCDPIWQVTSRPVEGFIRLL